MRPRAAGVLGGGEVRACGLRLARRHVVGPRGYAVRRNACRGRHFFTGLLEGAARLCEIDTQRAPLLLSYKQNSTGGCRCAGDSCGP